MQLKYFLHVINNSVMTDRLTEAVRLRANPYFYGFISSMLMSSETHNDPNKLQQLLWC